jgi:hypothetical protein
VKTERRTGRVCVTSDRHDSKPDLRRDLARLIRVPRMVKKDYLPPQGTFEGLSHYFDLCVPKIRFCNIGDEGLQGQAGM